SSYQPNILITSGVSVGGWSFLGSTFIFVVNNTLNFTGAGISATVNALPSFIFNHSLINFRGNSSAGDINITCDKGIVQFVDHTDAGKANITNTPGGESIFWD